VETNGGTAETTSYTYDPLDRLETVRYPADTDFPQGRMVTYGYDAVGNRIAYDDAAIPHHFEPVKP
jgi:YD repeat-containing protein